MKYDLSPIDDTRTQLKAVKTISAATKLSIRSYLGNLINNYQLIAENKSCTGKQLSSALYCADGARFKYSTNMIIILSSGVWDREIPLDLTSSILRIEIKNGDHYFILLSHYHCAQCCCAQVQVKLALRKFGEN